MRKFLLGGMAVLALSGAPALAADMALKAPAPAVNNPSYDWSGFYIGGHVGSLWGRTSVVENGALIESGAPTNGVVGGVLAGYNWQRGPLVLGIEGDFGWANAHGTGTGPPPPPAPPPPLGPPVPNHYNLNWDSHIVGKAGFAVGNWMIFGTGGLATAGFSFQPSFLPPAAPTLEQSRTYAGFSLGAGVEYAFTQNLLGRVQYIYDDFGSKNYTSDDSVYHVSVTSQTLRGALSWKF
jgi:outer membrane immunogenic protein